MVGCKYIQGTLPHISCQHNADSHVFQFSRDIGFMDFYQVPYAENVVCTSRSAQVFPDTTAGTVSGTAAYRFRNTSGQAWTAAFGVNPGYTISNVRVNGAEVPFSVSDYQEYNEAMLEVALPSDREIELTMDYGGFPRENRNVSIM